MKIFTIGYAKKSAQTFFEAIKLNKIDVLLDVRLYNSSQLAGFTKSRDLEYFLKQICNCEYKWVKQFAPTPELLDGYKNGNISWSEYEKIYTDLLSVRDGFELFKGYEGKQICLLCAEEKPQRCHRRLLAEKIAIVYSDVNIIHLP